MDMDGMRKPAGSVSMEPAIMPRPAPPSRARNLLRQDGERRKDLSSPPYKDEKKSEVRQLAPFSTAFCLIKAAAACEATSSSRRSVPRANRLLNSLSRTCRACKKRRRKRKSAQTQSLSAGHPVKLWLNKLGSETDRSRWQNVN